MAGRKLIRIGKRAVDAVKPGDADFVCWDRDLTGFGLRVRKSGRKVYVVQTRVDGKLRWFTIGQHGPLSPDEARRKALEILAGARNGIDAREEVRPADDAPTMRDLGRRFLDEYVPVHCKPSTAAEYQRSVRLFVDTTIGDLRVDRVQRKDIAALHHGLRDKPYQAIALSGYCRRCSRSQRFGAGGPTHPIPAAMSDAIRNTSASASCRRRRPSGWVKFCAKRKREMPSAVAAFRLLLLTGCRMSEIRDLRWEHVKKDCIELPDAKTGGRVVPLGPEARAVLSGISQEDGNPWVIAGRLPGSHLTDLQRPWRRIRKLAGLEDVRIHDLRHSFASRALALGESLTMIGKLLGHTQVQTTARYAHLARDSIQTAASRITQSIGSNLTGVAPTAQDKARADPSTFR